MCVHLGAKVGLRTSVTCLEIVFDWLGADDKLPNWTTVRTWMLRVGVAAIEEPIEQADDWIWMLLKHRSQPRAHHIERLEHWLDLSFRPGLKRSCEIPGKIIQQIRLRQRRLNSLRKREAVNNKACSPVVGSDVASHASNVNVFNRAGSAGRYA